MSYFVPTAKVIAASRNQSGNEKLITFEITFHRYILPQLNKHRAFSSNGGSSRAIPARKMIEKAKTIDVFPLEWQKNCSGMQGKQHLNAEQTDAAIAAWKIARARAIDVAEYMVELGLHKQIINRVLEPYLPMTMIVTTAEAGLKNFFDQRLHPSASPEMRALAVVMHTEYTMTSWQVLTPGQWHLPFYSRELADLSLSDCVKACVARCARVSYLNHNGERNIADDLRLAEHLLAQSPPHLSPFEHVAVYSPNHICFSTFEYGNFSGTKFWQVRKMLEYCRRWGGKFDELVLLGN